MINTNGNTEGIFPSVNFRGILPTEIFSRYIPRELPWEKKLKQNKKKWWRVSFTNGITDGMTNGICSVGNSVGKFVGKLWTLFIILITKGITDGIFCRYFPESWKRIIANITAAINTPTKLQIIFCRWYIIFTNGYTDKIKRIICF